MDIRAYSQVSGPTAGGGVAALPDLPADSRAALTQIAQMTEVPPAVRTELVQAVAMVDAGGLVGQLRSQALSQINSTGMYLKQTSSEGWPRWNVLTALRTYGLNIENTAPSAPRQTEQVLARAVQQHLDGVTRRERGVSVEQVQVKAPADSGDDLGADAPNHTVEKVA